MALGASNLTNGATATSATSFVTASVSPGANHLILLTVGSRSAATNNTPTATGAGMTWTLVSSQINALNTQRVTVFRALSDSPGSGTVTIDFAGQSNTACLWSIDDFSGTELGGTNGASAIIQSVGGLVTGTSTGITVTLAALANANNVAFGGCHRNGNFLLTAGTGYTTLSPGGTVGGSQHTEWKLNTTTTDWSWASGAADAEALAIEVAAAAVTPTTFWDSNDSPTSRRRRLRQLDEIAFVPQPPAAAAPTANFGWNENTGPPRVRRRPLARQLDEVVRPLRTVPGGVVGPHDLTDVQGMPLTDTLGVHLTDVFTATPSLFWLTGDETAPRKKRYRQLDETVRAPSPLDLPAPPFGWFSNDATLPKKRQYRQLDEVGQPVFPPAAAPTAPPTGWDPSDTQARRRRPFVPVDGIVDPIFVPVPTPTPSTFWLTDDAELPRKRRFRALDEAIQPLFPPPVIATVPTDYWQTTDDTARIKRRARQLDETVLAPSPFGLPAPPFGWDASVGKLTVPRKYRRQGEAADPIFLPSTVVATPSIFWLTDDYERPRRRLYRQLDETSQPWKSVAGGIVGPHDLTDVQGMPLTDTLGVHLTDVFDASVAPWGWATADDTARIRKRYRQLDEEVHVLSILGLPAVVGPPSAFWMWQEEPRPGRKIFRSLPETAHVISSLGLPAQTPTPSIFWLADDNLRRRRVKFVNPDETVITLALPPGLPAIIPPPSPTGSTGIAALNASFVFGPNTPQLGDLAVAVLQDLGVLESGQPVASEDAMTIIGRLFPKLEELNERDVAHIDADNISNAQFLPLVKIMAWECASAFTITDPAKLTQLQQKGAQGGEAEGVLKDIVRLRTPRQTMRVEIFTGHRWWH